MIADVEVAGIGGYTPDEPTKKYIRKKIGALDRLVTRHARKTISAIVKIEEKLAAQLRKYKEDRVPHVGRRGLLARFKRSYDREA